MLQPPFCIFLVPSKTAKTLGDISHTISLSHFSGPPRMLLTKAEANDLRISVLAVARSGKMIHMY